MRKFTGLLISLLLISSIACEMTVKNNGGSGTDETSVIKSFSLQIMNNDTPGRIFYGKIEGSTITVSVPMNTDVTKLVPRIEATGTVTINSGDTIDFNKPFTFTIIATDGKEYSYKVTVVKDENILAFYFEASRNSAKLSANVTGIIDGTRITAVVPNGTDRNGLVPTIVFDGSKVEPAQTISQDFTKPVTYTLTSTNGKVTKNYLVTVNEAGNASADITSFDFKKTDNVIKNNDGEVIGNNLAGDLDTITGTIDENGDCGDSSCNLITLTVPYGTAADKLKPAITITGKSISPANGISQNFYTPVEYQVTAQNGSVKKYQVRVTVAKDTRKEITEFVLKASNNTFGTAYGDIKGEVNGRTITVVVPCRSSITSIRPTISHNGSSIAPKSGEVLKFANDDGSINTSLKYTVTAADETIAEYTIIVKRMQSDCCEVTRFAFRRSENSDFPGVTIKTNNGIEEVAEEIDGVITANFIRVTVPYGTDLTNLKPFMAFNTNEPGNVIVSPSLKASYDFSSKVKYKVTSANGMSVTNYYVEVTRQNEPLEIQSFAFFRNYNNNAWFDKYGVPGEWNNDWALDRDYFGVIRGSNIEIQMNQTLLDELLISNPMRYLMPRIKASGGELNPRSEETVSFIGPEPVVYTVRPSSGLARGYRVHVVPVPVNTKEITSFVFLKADNEELPYDIRCAIDAASGTITGSVPYGVDLDGLKPRIGYSGQTVTPGNGEAADFTKPVAYTVKSLDGTSISYTANIAMELNNDKNITQFVFRAFDNNGVIQTDVAGVIGVNSVTVTVPYNTSLTSLKPLIDVSAGAVVNPISGSVRDFTDPVIYEIKAENGTVKNYEVTVLYGDPSKNAYLADIDFFDCELSPVFNSKKFEYIVTLPLDSQNAIVTAFPASDKARILFNGNEIIAGEALALKVKGSGTSETIAVVVIAEDGSTFSKYIFNVRYEPAAKEITSFSINGFEGVIDESNITVALQPNTDFRNLVANFTTNGEEVTVDEVVQKSGTTINDFTFPLIYTVCGKNNTIRDYTVTVCYMRTDKEITSFSINNVEGIINGDGIGVILRDGVQLDGLVPKFTYIGEKVTVNDRIQVSEVNAHDFLKQVVYAVHAEDGSVRNYIVRVCYKWSERVVPGKASPTDWFRITSSSDGMKLAAVMYYGYIYTSMDGGETWTEHTLAGKRYWFNITSSSDGTKLAAVVNGGYIYTSSDSGTTWTERSSAGSSNWGSITSSSDGTKLAAIGLNSIYTSSDSGATWTKRSSAGSRNWRIITSSEDGTKLAAVVYSGYIYTSSDSGTTWTERSTAGSRNWMKISSSKDGTKLAAVVYSGYIYTSSDSGVTWTERSSAGSRNWGSITSSSDGTKLAAAMYGNIYTSSDSGVTWTERSSAGSRNWADITLSKDGTKIAAVVNGGYIYTSNDSGATWIERSSAGNRQWYCITSSSDGTKLAALCSTGIYTSMDSGDTWVERISHGSDRFWVNISSSSDGTKLAAIDQYNDESGGYIYTSNDSGATWIERSSAGNRQWYCITSSSDGTKLAATDDDGHIYISSDSGETWIVRLSEDNRSWSSITSSADGMKLAAVGLNNNLYTSKDGGTTWIDRSPTGFLYLNSIKSSSDGMILAAVSSTYIYTSTDGGMTWMQRTSAGKREWMSIALSADGTKLAALANTFRNIFIGD